MPAFVIEYDRRTGSSKIQSFQDPAEAMRARFALMKTRSSADIEIVSITAPSLEAIRRSHSRYFRAQELEVFA